MQRYNNPTNNIKEGLKGLYSVSLSICSHFTQCEYYTMEELQKYHG